ncbi:thioredoxin domain-containing protein [Terriglobus albidus]|uniref:hypothetical protein n=1 Tax=Terriglobus albidus TaxID=1592106 RepID=UPI0021DF522D|nr:hypothetical protein [Terriglobus albidus]
MRINDIAPDLEAATVHGTIHLRNWRVCITGLGYLAGLRPEFQKRNCKIIGFSIDPVNNLYLRFAAQPS